MQDNYIFEYTNLNFHEFLYPEQFSTDFAGSSVNNCTACLKYENPMTAFGCGFNRSMQHLFSKYREEDVASTG